MLADDVAARPEPKMEGVAQNDLGVVFFQLVREHGFDAAVRADRHENRGLDHAVIQCHATPASGTVRGQQVELQAARGAIVVARDRHGEEFPFKDGCSIWRACDGEGRIV